MNKEITKFSCTEITKRNFHYSEYPIDLNNVDYDKTVIFIKVYFSKGGFRYLTG